MQPATVLLGPVQTLYRHYYTIIDQLHQMSNDKAKTKSGE